MRRLPSIVLAAVIAVSGACASEDKAPDSSPLAKRVQSVAATTTEAGSAKTSVELAVESSAEGEEPKKSTILAEGVWDFAANKGRSSIGVGTFQTEIVVLEGVLYTKSPQPTNPAKPWSKAPAKGGNRIGTTDPEQALTFLLGASGVKELEGEPIRGEATKKYSFTVDVKAAASQLPDGDRQAFEKSVGTLTKKDLPATVWVDAEGRMRRLSYSIVSKSDETSVSIVATMEFFEFGAAVDVAAPPAAEIG